MERKVIRMGGPVRVQVLMTPSEAERFERFCLQHGHKKSTLIARLIRDHLDREDFAGHRQPALERRAG